MNKCDTCKYSAANGGDGWSNCDSCIHDEGLKDRYEPMTNGDKIRAMRDEELAYWVMCHKDSPDGCDQNCMECSLKWLKAPATEGSV